MFPLADDARIFFIGCPIDLRNGFDGLSFFAATYFQHEIIPETYFVFINPRRTRMKLLFWTGDNYVIWFIRLRKGVFFNKFSLKHIQISSHDLRSIINCQTPSHLLPS